MTEIRASMSGAFREVPAIAAADGLLETLRMAAREGLPTFYTPHGISFAAGFPLYIEHTDPPIATSIDVTRSRVSFLAKGWVDSVHFEALSRLHECSPGVEIKAAEILRFGEPMLLATETVVRELSAVRIGARRGTAFMVAAPEPVPAEAANRVLWADGSE